MHRYRLLGSVGAYCEASNMADIRALLGLTTLKVRQLAPDTVVTAWVSDDAGGFVRSRTREERDAEGAANAIDLEEEARPSQRPRRAAQVEAPAEAPAADAAPASSSAASSSTAPATASSSAAAHPPQRTREELRERLQTLREWHAEGLLTDALLEEKQREILREL